MYALILGGAASGKSAYAEKLVLSQPRPHIYLATMEPWGEEGAARIEKHRRARAGRGFLTVERYTDLKGLDLPRGCSVLLEDLGNLTANELFRPDGQGLPSVLSGIAHLRFHSRNLTVVSNEVFTGGRLYAGDTLAYLHALGRIHRRIAAEADLVAEVVCGVADLWKGGAP